MMHHSTSVFYVVAIIAWLIYSFVSKSNKQKNKGGPVSEKTTRPQPQNDIDIKKVLEELMGKQQSTPPPAAPVYEPRKPTITPVYNTTEQGGSQEGKAMNPVDDYKFGQYRSEAEVAGEEEELKYEQFNSTNYTEKPVLQAVAEKQDDTVINIDAGAESTIARDFDIEKAIIYTEILKRPAWAV